MKDRELRRVGARRRSAVPAARPRHEDGAAAVEFALVLPILLSIVFAIIAYGIVFAQTLSLSNSARQAARSGVIEGTTCTQLLTLARDASDTIGMDGADTEVSVRRGSSDATATTLNCAGSGSTQPCKSQPVGTNLYVELTYDTQRIVPLVPLPEKVGGKGVFRCEFT